jgi:hypothetical protein
MPKAIESEGIHLPYRLLRAPFLNGDPIAGNENAGTIFAQPTVNKDLGVPIKQRKKLGYVAIRWIGPAPNRNADEAKPYLISFFLFQIPHSGTFGTKIDNRSNAHVFQLGKALKLRLSTPVKLIVDLAGVGDTCDMNFFSADRRECLGTERSLTESGASRNGEAKIKETQGQLTHVN